MATIHARVPTAAELDAFTQQLGEAISFLDELGPPERSIDREMAAFLAGVPVEEQYLTLDHVGVLFMAATEAEEAADHLRESAAKLLAVLPELVNRDCGYAAAYGEKASD